jgi:ubiquinone/menaquinone biosynthesis C-methylase UbiE
MRKHAEPGSPPDRATGATLGLSSATYSPAGTELEAQLEAAIEPWLAHMKWRKDFTSWRKRRIWQERYQEDNLRDIRQALGGSLAGRRLLDLGSGMGGLSVALLLNHAPEGMRLQAMDYNPDYCRIAQLRALRYGLDLSIAVAAGEQLPYQDGSFDCIICLDVLEHVADAARVLREMRRVLVPGGVVLTTVPNRRAFRDPHYHLPLINWLPAPLADFVIEMAGRSKREGPLQDRQAHSDLNVYTWREFKRLGSAAGFRVLDQVKHRILNGEIRQLRGWRRALLDLLVRARLFGAVYALYRYGWQGTYQILLARPG